MALPKITGLFPAERAFVEFASKMYVGGRVIRHGWPDFLVLHNGRTVGVEVKSKDDIIRPNQAEAFSLLEQAGIQIFVWNPLCSDKLIPWREYRPVRRPRAIRATKCEYSTKDFKCRSYGKRRCLYCNVCLCHTHVGLHVSRVHGQSATMTKSLMAGLLDGLGCEG